MENDIRCPYCNEYQDSLKNNRDKNGGYDSCWKCKKVFFWCRKIIETYKVEEFYQNNP